MSTFIASDLILGSLEKSHKLAYFSKWIRCFFFSCHKIRFCSFGSVWYVGRVGVTSERLFQNGKYKGVTLSIKEKCPPFWASYLWAVSPHQYCCVWGICCFIQQPPLPSSGFLGRRMGPCPQTSRGASLISGLSLRHLVSYCTFVLRVAHSVESVLLIENSYFEAPFSITLNLISLTMPEKWDYSHCIQGSSQFVHKMYVYFTHIYPGVLSSDQFPALIPAAHWLGHCCSNKFCLLPHPIGERLLTILVLTFTDLINFNGHANHLVNCRFWFRRSGLKPKFCVPNQLRRNSKALGLKTTLWATRIWATMYTASNRVAG